ncbi:MULTISPECIES: NADH-quinone oxidoreductase subunit NuoE [Marinifilum]|uniref:NADP-reducing hydrogenase subunit HndA n=1 Tax=Marinifilum flexuosum TaxID=1117708 RepID=A0A419X404_9BACT|nr:MULTISPECIES: NADH-quinone oxidoreductase subunit NuoE [Marinifilum]MCY1633987.1 NADH-quinone oxidoreductase subunit NuoE [Marinifilum sp. D737]RKE02442.1 NADP-reducing hydrogenase subunit HndA [Marinifilum flexuosum]
MDFQEKLVHDLVAKHGTDRENLLPILQGVIDQERYLSEEAILKIAKEMSIPAADVYGTATFYSFLDTDPRGKYVIRVCKTITCAMKGKNQIIQAIENFLKIKVGETTIDKKFTILQTNCLGWCHKAPAMLVNDDVYTELTPESVVDILREYREEN